MRWLLPKSLNGFLLLGLGMLAAPLLLTILQATVQMRRLSEASQRLVIDSVQTARLSQDMYAQIALLQRSARLYQVLADASVLGAFREHDEQLRATVEALRRQLRSPEGQRQLLRLGTEQDRIRALVLETRAPTAEPAQLTQSYLNLGDLASGVADFGNRQLDEGESTLRTQTDKARRELLLESTLLLPLVLIALLVFTLRLSRPLRQIDRAIGELGRGNFAHGIAVTGPVDLERLGRQLEWLRSRLLDLAQERNRFLRHMSHELKTPLANIREGTELLMDGAVGELQSAQREVTAILRENGMKLQRLIENLLSFSAWQAKSVGLEVSEFKLRPLIKSVLENQQLTLVAQRVRLDVQVEDLVPLADRGKIRLILDNLLSNAIKFTPRGGTISIHARAEREQLVLDVMDSGPGIPAEERNRIFEAFYQGKTPQGGHVKGTGIGLSVVTEFVNAHNGSIEILEAKAGGAHFRVRLPMRQAAPTSREKKAHAA